MKPWHIFRWEKNIKTYVCASSGCGTNTRKKLIDENGQEIYNTKGIDFMTYACADDTGVNIYYQTWTLVPEEEILKEKNKLCLFDLSELFFF